MVDIADDGHRSASGSAPQAQEMDVAGVAISFDRPGRAEDDAVAAFIVILPVGGASETGSPDADIVAAALLHRGLIPIATLEPDNLNYLPMLNRWLVITDQCRSHVTIVEPTGCLFDGFLGGSVPEGWYTCLAKQRALVLLITVENDSPIDSAGLANLCEAGRLLGGRVAVRPSRPPSAEGG